jgi:MoxR-like ATPase
METKGSSASHHFTLPFAERTEEVARLRELHAPREHALILGPEGVGKTALVSHLNEELPLLVCPQSERLGAID